MLSGFPLQMTSQNKSLKFLDNEVNTADNIPHICGRANAYILENKLIRLYNVNEYIFQKKCKHDLTKVTCSIVFLRLF